MRNISILILCISITAALEFEQIGVENNLTNPHCKGNADLNNDGYIDLIVGGTHNVAGLVWYEYISKDNWQRHIISSETFTTSLTTGDVDNDGDVDIIVPTGYNNGVHVWWFENPYPGSTWVKHDIGSASSHDVWAGDLDRDGDIEVVTQPDLSVFIQSGNSWQKKLIDGATSEGTALGDLDGDGDFDIAVGGSWYETPSDIVSGTFTRHIYAGDIDRGQKWATYIDDINQDGRNDILVAPSDVAGNREVRIYYAPSDPASGTWVKEVAFSNTDGRYHGLQSGDVDGDGDIDIVTAEMEQTSQHRVLVLLNEGSSWSYETIGNMGSHWVQLFDTEGDGDLDIFGANHGNNNGDVTVYYWHNNQQASLDSWGRHVIDSSRPWRSVFIYAKDIDGDGLNDVVTGGWWYKNPGSLDGNWQRNAFGGTLNNVAVIDDFDDDGDLDVLGTEGQGSQSNDDFVWARNDGTGSFTVLNNIENGDGDFLQGVAVDRKSVYLSWHQAGRGVQQLTVPSNPSSSIWTHSRISTTSQDEDLSLGDIDRDGDNDLLLGTKWLESPGSKWWNSNWKYRIPVTVLGTGYVDPYMYFNVGEPIDFDSIRVVGANDQEIVSQFEQEAALPEGRVVFFAQQGTYYVYFDPGPKSQKSYNNNLIVSNDNDEGQDSFRIQTPQATYQYHTFGAGFSSMIDIDGNDWINHHATGGSSGEYRGIPNLVYPEGTFHPGSTDSTSQIVHQGPVRIVIKSYSNDDLWESTWYVYEDYAEMVVDKKGHNYWFLYEGTPGGEFDSSDYVVRSDGSQTSGTWSGDLSGNEWVMFTDPADMRSLFVANLVGDSAIDSYRDMDGEMTVFGFGRSGTSSYMSQVPGRFTIGFIETTQYSSASDIINPLYSISYSMGGTETYGSESWTSHSLYSGGTPDRNELIDVNNDGRLDSVVGYEAISSIGKLAWYEQSSNTFSTWSERIIANIVGPMSIDAGDLDGDGDVDVVAGEHNLQNPSSAKLYVFEQANSAWIEHLVYTGDEHHDGAQLADMDGDGDLDIVSIGWSHDNVVVYENLGSGPVPCDGVCCTDICSNPIVGSCSSGTCCASQSSCNPPEPTCESEGYYCCHACQSGTSQSNYDGDCNGACCTACEAPSLCDGGVMLLSMDGGASDSIGSNNGIVNGATYTSGRFDGAYDFDGSDYMDVGNFNVAGNELTISAWIKADMFNHLSSQDARVISKTVGSAEQDHYFMLSSIAVSGQPYLRFRLKTGSTTTLIASNGVLQPGVWTHVAATYDGSQMRLYKDGVQVASVGKSGTIAQGTANVLIGQNPGGYGNFDGIIDDVFVSSRALSDTEIQTLSGSPVSCGCITLSDLIYVLNDWNQGEISLTHVMNSINSWKDCN